jgi:hypothetical protein
MEQETTWRGWLISEFHPAPEDEDEDEGVKELETYLPGIKLEDGEQLVPDNSVYLALHSLSYAWPCLSFDILRDNLGEDRSSYPHTAWLVTGTQAGEIPGQGKAKDEVVIMRMSGLSKTQYDDDSEAGDDDDDNEGEDEDAKLDFQTIPHVGNVNRIRAAPVPSGSAIPDPYHVIRSFETTFKITSTHHLEPRSIRRIRSWMGKYWSIDWWCRQKDFLDNNHTYRIPYFPQSLFIPYELGRGSAMVT